MLRKAFSSLSFPDPTSRDEFRRNFDPLTQDIFHCSRKPVDPTEIHQSPPATQTFMAFGVANSNKENFSADPIPLMQKQIFALESEVFDLKSEILDLKSEILDIKSENRCLNLKLYAPLLTTREQACINLFKVTIYGLSKNIDDVYAQLLDQLSATEKHQLRSGLADCKIKKGKGKDSETEEYPCDLTYSYRKLFNLATHSQHRLYGILLREVNRFFFGDNIDEDVILKAMPKLFRMKHKRDQGAHVFDYEGGEDFDDSKKLEVVNDITYALEKSWLQSGEFKDKNVQALLSRICKLQYRELSI